MGQTLAGEAAAVLLERADLVLAAWRTRLGGARAFSRAGHVDGLRAVFFLAAILSRRRTGRRFYRGFHRRHLGLRARRRNRYVAGCLLHPGDAHLAGLACE